MTPRPEQQPTGAGIPLDQNVLPPILVVFREIGPEVAPPTLLTEQRCSSHYPGVD